MSAAHVWKRALPILILGIAICIMGFIEFSKRNSQPFQPDTLPKVASVPAYRNSEVPPPEGANCAACHAEIVAQWRESQHALANRMLPQFPFKAGEHHMDGVHSQIREDGWIKQTQHGETVFEGQAMAVIGVEPLVQFLVETDRGQWQNFNPGYSTESNTWFNVFPEVRQPGEWGHWQGRAMTWNAQCAWCHMTGFQKNYDVRSDSYASSWEAMAISCAQCHGDLSAHAADPSKNIARKLAPDLAQENCMSCHARREQLTAEGFHAGERFNDHFRIATFERQGTYFADGQVLDENFESGSFLSSAMHDAGVSCLDCHNPHSGKLKAPVSNNALCLSCHAPPGRDGATPILPEEHSHHAAGSAGNRCVECHMPHTVYMQSDPRRDHGFTMPDPLLTRELGIPNACARCHEEQGQEWIEQHAEAWYGEALAGRITRRRARAIHRAWEGDPEVGGELLALAKEEKNVMWRSTLLRLLEPYIQTPGVLAFLRENLLHEHELVRNSALNSMSSFPALQRELMRFRGDESRMVRLDAAWATLESGGFPAPLKAELDEWLEFNADQPAGLLRLAQRGLREDNPERLRIWLKRLLEKDPSAEPYLLAGQMYHAIGDSEDAERSLRKALELQPDYAGGWMVLAMFLAEQGKLEDATEAFRKTVLLDPGFGRAWYNLGLAHNENGHQDAALQALSKAEELLTDSPDPAFAAATIHLQRGDKAAAQDAAARALGRNPQHPQARGLYIAIEREKMQQRMQGGGEVTP